MFGCESRVARKRRYATMAVFVGLGDVAIGKCEICALCCDAITALPVALVACLACTGEGSNSVFAYGVGIAIMRTQGALITTAIAAATIAGVVLVVGVARISTSKCRHTTAPKTGGVAPLGTEVLRGIELVILTFREICTQCHQ